MSTMVTMTTAECWQRLGAEGVGRIGFDRGRGPRIHPVNYTVVGKTVHVRTTDRSEFGSFVAMFSDGALVSFEVDQVAPTAGERWSVLVAARVDRLSPEQEHALAPGRVPSPDPSGPHPVLVRLTPTEITGRRLMDPAPGADAVRPDPGPHPHRAGEPGSPQLPSTWLG
jgi:nitroimidazol reductase NimA-like FMN-containing flavoprotein (pyridoxamine 5'-phosphate oxidase superfamily)